MTSAKKSKSNKTFVDYYNIEEDIVVEYPSMQTGPLSEDSKALARKELRETPENVKNGLDELKEHLENDPEMSFDLNDDFLLIFLRPCKFYAKSAYDMMRRVATFKQKNRIFDDLLPEDVLHVFLKHSVLCGLEDRDHKGRRVIVGSLGSAWDTTKLHADDIFKAIYLMSELAVLEPETQVRGCVIIMDYHGLALKQIVAFTPAQCARLMALIQDALPLRVKEVHVVRQPPYFKPVWTLMKQFVGEKMKKRIFFHGYKMSSLHKFIPPSYLPKDYNGDLPELTNQGRLWAHLFATNSEHMKNMNSCGFVKRY